MLKGWSQSEKGQILFPSELMLCCGISLNQVSKKWAAFHDARPPTVADVPADAPAAEAGASNSIGNNVLMNAVEETWPHDQAGSLRMLPSTPPEGVAA